MKTFMKKSLALFLVLCTILSVCPIGVLAADEESIVPEMVEEVQDAAAADTVADNDSEDGSTDGSEDGSTDGSEDGSTDGSEDGSTDGSEEEGSEEEGDSAEVPSGTCGEDLTWVLTDNGVLTISGSGAMDDMYGLDMNGSWLDPAPWADYQSTITEVVMEEGITYIGSGAFRDMENLSSVVIPEGVTHFGDYAFTSCTSLTEVSLPSTLEEVGVSAFAYTALTSVVIPDGVTTIKHWAFLSSSLTDAVIPESVTTIEEDAFTGTPYLDNIADEAGFSIVNGILLRYSGDGAEAEIPADVTCIGAKAFFSCETLTSVAIPASVTSINSSAFEYCTSLTDVYYEASEADWSEVTILDGNDCLTSANITYAIQPLDSGVCGEALTWVLTNDGTLTISGSGDMYAFEDGTQPWFAYIADITSVEMEFGVTSIGDYAFNGCESLTTVELPSTVSFIGEYTFADCSSLASIDLPNTVINLGVYAFYNCSALTSISIPDGVSELNDREETDLYTGAYFCSTFIGCSALTSVEIGTSLQTLSTGTFADSPNLTEATFKNPNTVIEEYAIGYYEASTGYVTNGDVTIRGYAGSTAETYAANNNFIFTEITDIFAANGDCGEALTWVLTDDGILTISGTGDMTAYTSKKNVPWYIYRNTISSVVIEDGVTSISEYAFYDCTGLVSADLPDSITSIGAYAFFHCISLESIAIPQGVSVVAESTFMECTSLKTVVMTSNITSIGELAFGVYTTVYDSTTGTVSCGSLTDVALPDSITSIAPTAFYGNTDATVHYCSENSVGYTYAVANDMPVSQHYWDEGVVTVHSTTTTTGTKVCNCVVCGTEGTFELCTNGLHKVDGIWGYYIDGSIDTSYTSYAYYGGAWWYVKEGIVDFSFTGLCKYGSSWYYAKNGKVDFSYTGYAYYGGSWWYVKSGKVDFSFTGLCKHGSSWYYAKNGKVDFSYTGYAYYGGSWWYVKSGKVDFSFTGLCKHGSSLYYAENGKVNFSFTGLCKYGSSWYYVNKGKVDFSYTGYITFNNTKYYVYKGKVT